MLQRGNSRFFEKTLSKTWKNCYLEPGLSLFYTDIIQATDAIFQERHNHSESCITVRMSQWTQKVEIYLANEESDLSFFNTDLGHNYGSNVSNDSEAMLRRKVSQKPEFADDIVGIYSLMIYADLIEYTFVGDAKALCCSVFPLFQSSNLGIF